jgi:hypothetical protein
VPIPTSTSARLPCVAAQSSGMRSRVRCSSRGRRGKPPPPAAAAPCPPPARPAAQQQWEFPLEGVRHAH